MMARPLLLAATLSGMVVSQAIAQSAASVIEYPNPTESRHLPDDALRVDIGGSGGVEFHRIVAILPRRDGSFIVVNGGTNEFRFFDAAGRLTSTAGRRGAGPGEYSNIREAGLLPGDSIAVFDVGGNRRVSILDPAGRFVRSFRLEPPWEGGGAPTRMVANRGSTVLVGYSEIRQMPPRPDAVYFGQRLFPYATTGELRSTNALVLPESEHFVQVAPPTMGGVAYWDLAFGRIMTIRATGASILTGDGTEWTIEQRTATGFVSATHRLRRAPMAVTTAQKEAWSSAALAGSQGNQRAINERMIAEMPWPGTMPAYRRFEINGAGHLWIESYPDVGQTRSTWIRLDPRTRATASVVFPDRFRALAFTETLVYGVWRDSDDVEHVRVYALGTR